MTTNVHTDMVTAHPCPHVPLLFTRALININFLHIADNTMTVEHKHIYSVIHITSYYILQANYSHIKSGATSLIAVSLDHQLSASL